MEVYSPGPEEGVGLADRRGGDRVGRHRPAYSLTGALGHGADEVGYQMPIIFVLAVIPMYFVALAYRHLTDAAPDAGTVFTWGRGDPAAHRLDRADPL